MDDETEGVRKTSRIRVAVNILRDVSTTAL